MNEKLFNKLFGNLSFNIKSMIREALFDLERETLIDMNKEETEALRKKLGVYGEEAANPINFQVADYGRYKSKYILDSALFSVKNWSNLLIKLELMSPDTRKKEISKYYDTYLTEDDNIMGSAVYFKPFLERPSYVNPMLMDVSSLGFSKYILTSFKFANIVKVGDLLSKSLEEIKQVRGIGSKGIEEIVARFSQLGLSFSNNEDKNEIDVTSYLDKVKSNAVFKKLFSLFTLEQQDEVAMLIIDFSKKQILDLSLEETRALRKIFLEYVVMSDDDFAYYSCSAINKLYPWIGKVLNLNIAKKKFEEKEKEYLASKENYLNLATLLKDEVNSSGMKNVKADYLEKYLDDIFRRSILSLGLKNTAYKVLTLNNINTVGELVSFTKEEILAMDGMDSFLFDNISYRLQALNISLKDDDVKVYQK